MKDNNLENIVLDNPNLLPEFLEALFEQNEVVAEIIPIGIFNRPSTNEIERYDYIDTLKKRIYYSNRTSIYDGLPKRLFHHTMKPPSGGDVAEDSKEHFKRTREEESQARDFFSPVDRIIQDLKIDISRCTYGNIADGKNNFLCLLFDALWSEYSTVLTQHQKIIYMAMIARRQYILGNVTAISSYLALLTGEIVTVRQEIREVNVSKPLAQHKYRLGLDFALGIGFTQREIGHDFILGPIKSNKMDRFLDGTAMDQAIRFVLSSVMPIESNYTYRFHVKKETNSFKLSTARIGYNTTINA